MRIVNRIEFLKLPKGILYSKYKLNEGVKESLCIKNETIGDNDWSYLCLTQPEPINCNNYEECLEVFKQAEQDSNFNFELDMESSYRDGLYEEDIKFLIYDENDINKVINLFSECIKGFKNKEY